MEQYNYLGMYLTPEGIYCAVVSGKGHHEPPECFFVPSGTEQGVSAMTSAARQALGQARQFEQSAIAVRNSLINQYYLHSDFADMRQIEGTIRFDVEEVAASDASTLAVAFEITNTDPAGSDVTVYTGGRQTLTDILLDLKAAGLDPTYMEPDAVCLSRALEKSGAFADKGKLFLLVFHQSCYLLTPGSENFAAKSRTFLLPDEENRALALSRQIMMTHAGLNLPEPVHTLVLVGHSSGMDTPALQAQTGFAIETMDLQKDLNLAISYEIGADQAAGFLFAVGAATGFLGRTRRADFRRDFMPYQGRRRILQRSLQVVSVSLTILFIAAALYFQTRAFRMKNYSSQLNEKLTADYVASMYGKRPPANESIGSKLRRELVRVKQLQQYGIDENSITARLTYILEAINNTPKTVDVNIKRVTISERVISIIGDTNSRTGTRELFDSIKKHKRLEVTGERFNTTAGNRDEFNISMKIREG